MKNLIQSAFCLLLILFLACRKENSSREGTRLKMITARLAGSDDSTVYKIFKYDAIEKLTTIIIVYENKESDTIELFYDNTGKLAKAVTRFSPPYGGEKLDSFYYDNNDRINRMRTVSDDHSYPYVDEILLTYDAAGRLIADTTHFRDRTDYDFISYQYDANDDPVQWEYTSTYQGTPYTFRPEQASYSTNPNPYKQFGIMYYLLMHDNIALSAHERTSESWAPHFQITYQYDYFQNGLVKRITVDQSHHSPSTSWLDFLYE